jgi:hypothetical protein
MGPQARLGANSGGRRFADQPNGLADAPVFAQAAQEREALMLKTFGSHVRGNVVGYIALFVALGGTTYAATGDNFILGQANTAGASTELSSGTSRSVLKVTNTGNGWALNVLGNATQSLQTTGLVKAMAFVDPIHSPSDPIRQCFNSQRLFASSATSDDCGMSYSRLSKGVYVLSFNFAVDERPVSATTVDGDPLGVHPYVLQTGEVVASLRSVRNETSFWIIVY